MPRHRRKVKRILTVVLVFVFIIAPLAIGLTALFAPETTVFDTEKNNQNQVIAQRPSLTNIYVPKALRDEGIGLFWLHEDNGKIIRVKSTTEEAVTVFDPTKPILIFFHGMQKSYGANHDEGFENEGQYFLSAGYNTAVFYWSQFADEGLPMLIESKLWGIEGSDSKIGMRWRKTDNSYEEKDVPNAPLAVVFAAFYLDFMEMFPDYSGSSINFMGHSLGGQLSIASSSYLITAAEKGIISKTYVPDRLTLCDPYIMRFENKTYCTWLEKSMATPKTDGNGNPLNDADGEVILTDAADFISSVVTSIADYGVAIELIPSVDGVVPPLYSGEPKEKLYAASAVWEFSTDWITDLVEEFNSYHRAGLIAYSKFASEDYLPEDVVFNESGEYALSPLTPVSYIRARRGVVYAMEQNFTRDDVSDDVIFSTNIDSATVAGFTFFDANGNGVYDDRIQNLVADVKVELYLKSGAESRFLGSCLTNNQGFYAIDIPAIYANRFDTLFVKVSLPSAYRATVRSNDSFLMNNDINFDTDTSDTFVINHQKQMKIINVGLTENK